MINLSFIENKSLLTEYVLLIMNNTEKIKNLKKSLQKINKLNLSVNDEICKLVNELPTDLENLFTFKDIKNPDSVELFLKKGYINKELIKDYEGKIKEFSFSELVSNYDIDLIPSYTPLSFELYPFSSFLTDWIFQTRSLEEEYMEYDLYDNNDCVYKNNIKCQEFPYIKRYLIPTYISFFINKHNPPIYLDPINLLHQAYPGDISALRDFYILSECKELSNGDLKSVKKQVRQIVKNMLGDICESIYMEEGIKTTPTELMKMRKEDLFNWGLTYTVNNFLIDYGFFLEPKEFETYITIPTDIILLKKSLGSTITPEIGYEKLIKNIAMLTQDKQIQEILENYIYALIYEENKFYEKVKSHKIILGEFNGDIIINPVVVANPNKHLIKEMYIDIKKHLKIIEKATSLISNIPAHTQHNYIKKVSLDIYETLVK